MSEPKPPFTVRAERASFAATFLCPTPEAALKQAEAFGRSQYDTILITDADGAMLTEEELARLQAQEATPDGGAPIDLDAPSAPVLVALA